MGEPYIGEIRIFGFSFAPRQWAFCNGQLMSIAQNDALYAILGTTFGGDGQTTFALPDIQGSAPMHWGNGPGLTPRMIGEKFGQDSVTLLATEMPGHNHMVYGADTAPVDQRVPTPTAQAQLSLCTPGQTYSDTVTPPAPFSAMAIGIAGQSQPHENIQPLLTLNFCIALFGIFPSRN